MLKWIYKDKNSTYLVWVYRFEKKIIERAPFKANLLGQSHIDNEAGAPGKNRPPPWRKINFPPFFREICIGNMLPTIWGVCISWIYMLVLDISCQHLGDECKLDGFCVPFGHKVGECTFLEMYNCIGYMLPTIWGVCFNWNYRLILDIWCTTCET